MHLTQNAPLASWALRDACSSAARECMHGHAAMPPSELVCAFSPVCGATAEMLGFVYTLVFTFLLIIAATGMSQTMERAKTIWFTLADKGSLRKP